MTGKEVELMTRNKGADWKATQVTFQGVSLLLTSSHVIFTYLFCFVFFALWTIQNLSVGEGNLTTLHIVCR